VRRIASLALLALFGCQQRSQEEIARQQVERDYPAGRYQVAALGDRKFVVIDTTSGAVTMCAEGATPLSFVCGLSVQIRH